MIEKSSTPARKWAKNKLPLFIRNAAWDKLKEICDLENEGYNQVIERLIMEYTPKPKPKIPGHLKTIYLTDVNRLNRKNPYSYVINVYNHGKLGPYKDSIEDFKKGYLPWEGFINAYIDRLHEPDAQEEIKNIRKYLESRDVYITSHEVDEEYSVRKLFVDLFNGGKI